MTLPVSEPDDECVVLSTDGPTATLTLNRPAKLNALIPAMFVRIRAHLSALSGRDDIDCLILQGAGRSFCAGHDLDAIGSGDEAQYHQYEAETIDLLETFAHPTIAKIHGHCLTGGLELALGCDLIVSSESAKIGDTHGKWGLVPVWGMSARLPERVGLAMAKELSFTSRVIDGATAKQIGLVNRSVAGDSLDDVVAELAAEIANNSTGSNAIGKRLYRNFVNERRQAHLEFERVQPYGVPSDGARRIEQLARKI